MQQVKDDQLATNVNWTTLSNVDYANSASTSSPKLGTYFIKDIDGKWKFANSPTGNTIRPISYGTITTAINTSITNTVISTSSYVTIDSANNPLNITISNNKFLIPNDIKRFVVIINAEITCNSAYTISTKNGLVVRLYNSNNGTLVTDTVWKNGFPSVHNDQPFTMSFCTRPSIVRTIDNERNLVEILIRGEHSIYSNITIAFQDWTFI